MPKLAKELSALEVKRLTAPGLHPIGTVAGLRLRVKDSGARSWVLRTMVRGRRAEIGLGGYPTVTLAQAVERARKTLDAIRDGGDPASERRTQRQVAPWTFKRTAGAYIADHRAGWKNAKHAAQWGSTLEAYVYPHFGEKHVRDVDKADVIAAIKPHWTTKNETMVRVRNRIELVLAYAMQHGYRPEGLNPARWKGNLDVVLPAPGKVNQREHFEAVPVDGMGDFMLKLRAMHGTAARALEFAILTASRTGAVRLAEWSEVDLERCLWTVPKQHMKSGREHRVPLSPQAVALLRALPRFEGVPLVFPGRGSKPLSDMSLTACMRRLGLTAVPHGFRSTFADWCAERTATPPEVREMALAHAIGDKTEEAYRRGDLFAKRAELMTLWAKFVGAPSPRGNAGALRGDKGHA